MAVDIEELIIAPFRELVKHGKEAVANAEAAADNGDGTSQPMAKAAKAILREGERGLKRLQSLWDDQVEKYGDAFKAAMSKNGEIGDKLRKLENLLYDFEDYLEVNTFDEERFAELQAAAKSYALHVLDIIKRLKLDGAPISPHPKATSFPPLPPLPPGALLQAKIRLPSRPSTLRSSQSASNPLPARSRDGPPQGTENGPRSPSVTPNGSGDSKRKRLTPQGLMRQDTTVSQASSHYSADTLATYLSEEGPVAPVVGDIDTFPWPPSAVDTRQQQQSAPGGRPQSSSQHAQRHSSTPDALSAHVNPVRQQREAAAPTSSDPGSPYSPVFHINRTTAWVTDQAATTTSPRLAIRPLPICKAVIPEGQVVTNMTTFNTSRPLSPVESLERGSSASPLTSAPLPLSLPPAADIDSGLMASEGWKTVLSEGASFTTRALSSVSSRETDCRIGPKSSLYQMKGFCEGAQAFKQGGHLQAVKKALGYVAGSTAQTGKCTSCGYAHNYEELSLDVGWSPKANFTTCNVRFRVRFLYKSHLITERLPEGYYGCLFCAQTGSVVREGDATVFANSDNLFRHLARHPQPLPEVPGITVLYGKGFPDGDSRLNDYDVHFPEPPSTDLGMPATAAAAADMARLPVATATKMHLQRWGEKKLPRPDGVSEKGLLQFFVAARIIGVEYPVKLGGKWATGWHDGEWGVFPAKSIELEKPRRGETPPPATRGTNGRIASVVTRWKFEPRDAADKGWLVFDKGETITNVGWICKEHWCWSGTNHKGQLGFFPRSHVHFDKVKEELAAIGPTLTRPTTSGRPAKVKRGLFSWNRHNSSVAPSSTSSISGGSSVVEIVL